VIEIVFFKMKNVTSLYLKIVETKI